MPADLSPSAAAAPAWRRARWLRVPIVLAALLALLVLVYFPWDWLRGPINRQVSERTGRHFAITRHLDVRLGRVSTVVLDGIEFANPPWAREPWLLRAQGGEFQVELWPLLSGRLVLPQVRLRQPEIGLQLMPDGRRTWALDRQQSSQRREPEIGELVLDRLSYFAPGQRIDVVTELALAAESSSPLPLSFKGRGQWHGHAFTAQGRTGGVLRFAEDRRGPFALELQASAGSTHLQAQGRITHLAELAGMDMRVQMQGQNLEHLFGLFGVALPASPAYRVQGQLHKQGQRWQVQGLQGQLGGTDLQGALSWDRSEKTPWLTGQLRSGRLDLADLGPMIGLPPPGRNRPVSMLAKPRREGRLLPAKRLDFSRLHAMQADVTVSAERIVNAPRWPLESVHTRVRLQAGRLRL